MFNGDTFVDVKNAKWYSMIKKKIKNSVLNPFSYTIIWKIVAV